MKAKGLDLIIAVHEEFSELLASLSRFTLRLNRRNDLQMACTPGCICMSLRRHPYHDQKRPAQNSPGCRYPGSEAIHISSSKRRTSFSSLVIDGIRDGPCPSARCTFMS
jgi:hypothetical protein